MELFLWISCSVCIVAFTLIKIVEKIFYLRHPERYPNLKKNKEDVSSDVKEV